MSATLARTESRLRPPIFIVPGANPSPQEPEAGRNLVIVPIEQAHGTIHPNDELNDNFRRRIGLIDQDLRAWTGIAPESKYTVLERGQRSPIAFIVTTGGASAIADNLSGLLTTSPQIAKLLPQLERVWLPLLGMQASGLSYEQSLQAILDGITAAGPVMSRDRTWRLIVATSDEIDPATLIRLRWIVENWEGRTPVDLPGALSASYLSMDGEATAVLELAANLARAQRAPMDNGELGTRSLLFALGGSWPQLGDGLGQAREAFARALAEVAGTRRVETQNFYFRDNATPLADHAAPPVVFEGELLKIMRAAARSALSGVIGVTPLASALLDGCEADLPRPIRARRVLTRMRVEPADLRQAFTNQLAMFNARPPVSGSDITVPYAPLGNDSADQTTLDDKLGVEVEACAFARVAAAKGVSPPLAFGIFGDWGSGKSFFMRLVHRHVERLQDQDPAKRAPEAASGLFHGNIVQIRFNAWHYAETELWASLVENIFSELDRWVLARTQTEKRNALFDNLATARELTLEAAERLARRREEQRAATARLAEAERNLAVASETTGATPRAFWSAVLASFYKEVDRQELKAAFETIGLGHLSDEAEDPIGLGHLSDEAEDLKRSLDSLKDNARRGSLVAVSLARRLIAAPSLIVLGLLILLLPAGLLELRNWLAGQSLWPWLQGLIGEIHDVALGVAGVLASAAAVIAVAGHQVRTATRKLEEFRKQLDKAVEDQLKQPAETVKEAQRSLARLKADILEAQSLLAASSDRVAEAAREYETGTGRARLLRFVRERVANGDYARHLGLIATIRKDFTELSDLMVGKADTALREEARRQVDAYRARAEALIKTGQEKQLMSEQEIRTLRQSTEAPPTTGSDRESPVFDRIILYIDDLDRCEPRKVVDVLQAVHLLLTFPLFIVVVAVDVRWVSRSLEKHYSELIGSAESATAVDYLEKIFQVPYWVRPLTKGGSQKLLMHLATPKDDAPSGVQPPTDLAAPSDSGKAQGTEEQVPHGDDEPGGPEAYTPTPPGTEPVHRDPMPKREKVSLNDSLSQPDPLERRSVQDQATTNQTQAKIVARALELTAGERAFMEALVPFAASTPRRVLRFLNVYRVIKASLGSDELETLENRGGYRALMTQLAVATESPDLYGRWLAVLGGISTAGIATEVQARLKAGLKEAGWTESLDAHGRTPGALDLFWSVPLPDESRSAHEAVQDHGLKLLSDQGEIARRYSFSD